MKSIYFLSAALLLFIAISALAQQNAALTDPANASIGPPAKTQEVDEIVVTARRRNETMQNVPATVSVLTSEDLRLTGVKNLADVSNLTAGVSIMTGVLSPTDTSINIRGLNGARDAETNVALVVDGVLQANKALLNQPQGALEQVEVLKGPQGALYGLDAEAGAIVISTIKPGSEFKGEVTASGGNKSSYSTSIIARGPITPTLGFVLFGDYGHTNGDYQNTFLPTVLNTQLYPGNSTKSYSINPDEHHNVNARLLFSPTSDIELDAKAHYGYDRAGAVAYNAIFQIPALVTAFSDPIFNENANNHQFIFTNNFAPQSHQATADGSLKFSDSLGFATAVASVAFSRVESDYAAGGTSGAFGFFDGSPSCINTRAATAGLVEPAPFTVYQASFGFAQPYAPNTCDGTQYEQRIDRTVTTEIRLLSSQDSELTWQGGLSYVNTHEDACTTLELNTGVGAAYTCYSTNPAYHTEQMEDDTYESKVFAAFGSADYAFTPKFRTGLALRYDIEQLNAVNDVPTDGRTLYVGNVLTGHPNGTATVPANYYLNPGLDPAYNPSGVLPPRSTRFTQLEPKVTFSYLANPDLTLFADWGIGFKGGGFNPGGTTEIINGYFNAPVAVGSIDHGVDAGLTVSDQYKKETTSAFEAGLKGKLFDRVTYELTGYYTRVSNMQYFEFFVGPFGQLRVITNIDRVNIAGFEGSARARLVEGWSVFATGNLTDSTIEKYTARPYTVGNEAPYTPHYTANAGTEFTTPITEGMNLTFRTDVRLTGPTPFSPVQNNTVPTIFGLDANFENSIRAAYTTVNARLGIDNPRWSIFAYGTNIFNKQYLADVVPAPEFGGSFISPGPLRRFGIEFSVKN